MFVTRNVTYVTFYREPFEPRESHGVVLFTLFSVALSAVPRKRFRERRSTIKKKKGRRTSVDRLSRASRAVDLHVAGSDKSATAETAATSREIDGVRRREKRVAALRLHAICLDSRAFSSVGFVSQGLSRKLLGIAFASHCLPFLCSPRRTGESFPVTCPRRRRALPGTRRDLMPRISDNLHLWCITSVGSVSVAMI